ncbi:MAG: transketolase [Armatimonadia bacterium]|nr:transketolase [Armatimonadia bacterium]
MRDAFVDRLMELAEADPRIILVTGDLGFGVLVDPTPDGSKPRFAERFPRQYLNAGVAEQNMTGLATGLALEGRIAFTYSIANFPTLRCLEQVRNDAAYHGANVKVVAIGGGFSYGALGISHHATEDLAIMRSLPDVTVVSPGDIWETQEATTAIVETPGTCYLRLDKSTAPPTHRDGEVFELGKARVVREGSDLTLIATGGILGEALEAADRLSDRGIQCRVLSLHTLRPFDHESVVTAARETGGLVTIEEHTIHGGLGSAVAEACLDAGVMPGAFSRIGLEAGFSSIVGSQQYLRSVYGMDAESIVERCQALLGAIT